MYKNRTLGKSDYTGIVIIVIYTIIIYIYYLIVTTYKIQDKYNIISAAEV